jgi:uncharacterized protein (DUF1499 family)
MPGLLVVLALVLAAVWLANALVPPPAHVGRTGGALRPAPDRPNWVASFSDEPARRVEPFRFTGDAAAALARVKAAALAAGGRLRTETPDHLHFTFTTPLLRFVDDVEFVLDAPAQVIHVRSASRVGHGDLGANRRRVAAIRAAWGR